MFVLCARDNFRFPDRSFCSQSVIVSVSFVPCSFKLNSVGNLLGQDGFSFLENVDVTKPWNDHNQVPISTWLAHVQSQDDKSRLKCMGNIVVPLQAYQASRMLARMEPLMF